MKTRNFLYVLYICHWSLSPSFSRSIFEDEYWFSGQKILSDERLVSGERKKKLRKNIGEERGKAVESGAEELRPRVHNESAR